MSSLIKVACSIFRARRAQLQEEPAGDLHYAADFLDWLFVEQDDRPHSLQQLCLPLDKCDTCVRWTSDGVGNLAGGPRARMVGCSMGIVLPRPSRRVSWLLSGD